MAIAQSYSLVQETFSNRYKTTWSDCKLPPSVIKLQSRPIYSPSKNKTLPTDIFYKRNPVELGKYPKLRKSINFQAAICTKNYSQKQRQSFVYQSSSGFTDLQKSPKPKTSYGTGRDMLLRMSNQRAQTCKNPPIKKVEDKKQRPFTTGVLLEKKKSKRKEIPNSIEEIRKRNKTNLKYIYNGVDRVEYNRPSNLQIPRITHKNINKMYSSNNFQPPSKVLTKLRTRSEWKSTNSSTRYFPKTERMFDFHQKNPFLTPNSVVMSRRRN